MTNQPSSYGVSERLSARSRADEHVERIALAGFTVIESHLTPQEVAALVPHVDRLLRRQAEEAGGVERLVEIGEDETARCCLAYDEEFLPLVRDPAVGEVCRLLLGDYFILMQQNAIVNAPAQSHTQRAYHRDLPYQHFVSSRPLAVSALFCVDPFSSTNGATVVLPGSHKLEHFPSESVVRDLETVVEATAGSFIVFDSMIFHRAGVNVSAAPRRAVNHVFTRPFIAQQISFPSMLDGRYSDDPELARLLGYGIGTVPSVSDWWERRRRRAR